MFQAIEAGPVKIYAQNCLQAPAELHSAAHSGRWCGGPAAAVRRRMHDLNKGEKQSDGSLLTPYQQARRYGGYLPVNQQPRWIVVCNFTEFRIHDMNRPNDTPEILLLSDVRVGRK